uniref:GWxTD domain-containing protein n=1 Tax=candidate division WOR-3 bacterium TaxID=2052148 RepID=A0A7C4U7H2_UNCW3
MVAIIISLIMDYSVFRISDDTSYCEIYYSIQNKFFTYIKEDINYVASFSLKIDITNLSTGFKNTTIIPKAIITPYSSEPTSHTIDFIPLFLLSGYVFLIKITVIDSVSNRMDSTSMIIYSPQWKDFCISSVQITNRLISDRKTPFEKNGLNLLPFPERLFNIESPLLSYYCEVYGLPKDTINTMIGIFQKGNLIKLLKDENEFNSLKTRVIAGSVNILGLTDGKYTLVIQIKSKDKIVKSEKDFEIVKTKKTNFVKSLKPDEKEIALFIDYLLPQEELSIYKMMSDSEKIEYAEKFWARQDPNPSTFKNEAFDEFLKRVKYADDNFPEKLRKGRFSERGRICIKYGIPTEIVSRSYESGYTPYQIWQYQNLQNPVSFLFVDKSNIGVYELVFSTIKEEPMDKNFLRQWRKYISEEDVFSVIGLSDYIQK